MNERQKKILWFGLGTGVAVAIYIPLYRREWAEYKAIKAKSEAERKAIWIAAGTVIERIRRGAYGNAGYEAAYNDFEFERIRIMEEG